MTTIPLSDVVAFLTRRGMGLACLEGAPIMVGVGAYRGKMVAFNPERHSEWCGPGDLLLYLGRDAICPAAMGWAAVVLGVARGLDLDRPIWLDFRPDWYVMWVCQSSHGAFGWAWLRPIDRDRGAPDERTRIMSGDRPLTVAARLLAVLKYEIGRCA